MKAIKLYLILILSSAFQFSNAQDPIFTQYFMVPQTINPGFAGYMETMNAGILHRTQWPDLNLKLETEYAFFNTWVEGMNSGIGINLLNHRENFTSYNYQQVNINYAYKVELNDEWVFRPAIEVGYGIKSFGFQNLILNDQINIGSGYVSPISIDPLTGRNKMTFFDFNAGLLFNTEKLWFGAAIKHLNKPNISFTDGGNIPLAPFMSFSAGYEFDLSDHYINWIFPSDTKILVTANYMRQAEYNRLDIGAGIVLNKLYLGATAATNPIKTDNRSSMLTSINLFGGLRYENFRFGLSYDYNTTKIGKTGGVYELGVTYQFDVEAKCFGCPNYNN
jgi:type IX secretion system PorP/SprF family membrane protein